MAKKAKKAVKKSKKVVKKSKVVEMPQLASIHTVKSIFPIKTAQGVVINETCSCGHLRSEHKDGVVFPVYGHGPCGQEGCACNRFTWVSTVLKETKVKAALADAPVA